ncbi:23909_t:CDS:2 [Gigaspora margarita]|uniref:23909_t:CDS:1 n=1 Tax=Gigaspora margarita TaxID=4874 RepID=A0ABN7V247_GIGMA|nr:23909_t:CDS:2 [Gigaspora margarita]
MPLINEIDSGSSTPYANVTSLLESCADVTSESETSNDRSQKETDKEGPFSMKWNYVIKGERKVPKDIQRYWRNKLIDDNNANKRDPQLPLQNSLKSMVMANIPFEVIENPYIKNLFKGLNPAYVLLSHTTLSGRLLDEEVARVQNNINNGLENAEHLTLSNFITSEIEDIIKQIGPQKFAAIITDSAANLKCIAHAINLITTDLSKIHEIKIFIDQCGKIIKHFNKSPHKLALLRQGLSSMKIRSEGLGSWCQTRWGSLYDTTNSVLLARPVFDWLAATIYQIPEINPFKPAAIQIF